MAFIERNVVEVDWTAENVGMEVAGRLVAVERVNYKDGPGTVFTLKTKTPGEVIRFKGAARLNVRLHASDVGKLVIVRYKGEDKSREMPVGMSYPKDFIVAVDEESGPGAKVPVNQHGVAVTDSDIPF